MKKLRVVHFGTGRAGAAALRTIVKHPELDLVGHYVHAPEKVGKDSGELFDTTGFSDARIGRVGVKATNKWEELLALKPDCLCYAADARSREPEAVREIAAFLEQGANAVSTSLLPLTYPPSAPKELREPIERACIKGGTSFYNAGIDPGYATAILPIGLLSIAGEIKCLRMQELSNYSEYPVVWLMRDVFGFGRPLDYFPPIYAGGALHRWKGTVQLVADAVKLKLDSIEAVHHKPVPCPRDLETAIGHIDAGTIGATRFEIIGMVRGQPKIVLEHVSFVHTDVAPHWPQPVGSPPPEHQYRMVIEGDPAFTCELDCTSGNIGGQWTGNFVANAIPSVCAAKPGALSVLDLPAYVTRDWV